MWCSYFSVDRHAVRMHTSAPARLDSDVGRGLQERASRERRATNRADAQKRDDYDEGNALARHSQRARAPRPGAAPKVGTGLIGA